MRNPNYNNWASESLECTCSSFRGLEEGKINSACSFSCLEFVFGEGGELEIGFRIEGAGWEQGLIIGPYHTILPGNSALLMCLSLTQHCEATVINPILQMRNHRFTCIADITQWFQTQCFPHYSTLA